jgi:hypothetical protein
MVVKGFYLMSGSALFERGNAYEYDPSILDWSEELDQAMNATITEPPFYVQVHDSWWDADFTQEFGTRRLVDLQQLIYSPMAYSQHQLYAYSVEKFGMHFVYFLSNFLLKYPNETFAAVKQIIDTVPTAVAVFGVHLREQFPGQFYTYSFEQSMNVVAPFLRQKIREGPIVFAFASDSKHMEQHFLAVFRKWTIQTKTIRKPDFDHKSALLDLLLLEMANDCLLSFRSTFSFAVVSRRGTRCFFVDKEAPAVFQFANSQAGSVSMQFTAWDVNDWQTSRRYIVKPQNEQAMRYYYKYLMF